MNVKIENLTKVFPGMDRKSAGVTAVDDFTLDIPDGKGEEIHILFSVSNHASIPELTSTHNILEATAQELKDAFSIGNTVSLPVSGVPNLKI